MAISPRSEDWDSSLELASKKVKANVAIRLVVDKREAAHESSERDVLSGGIELRICFIVSSYEPGTLGGQGEVALKLQKNLLELSQEAMS